jgi:hypothetical protein
MTIITQEAAEKRLTSPSNLVNTLDVRPLPRGGGKVGMRWHNSDEKLDIAEASLTQSSREVAETFGVSPSTVERISRDPSLQPQLGKKAEELRDLALDKLMASLGVINDQTLSKVSARDASMIAANMSKVVDRLSPKAAPDNRVLVIYAPQQRDEKNFKVVDL